jgi:hypothetical protein
MIRCGAMGIPAEVRDQLSMRFKVLTPHAAATTA